MGLWDLLEDTGHGVSPMSDEQARSLSFQDWVNLFTYQGVDYPMIQTTMGPLNEESVAATLAQAYRVNGPVFALVMARLQIFTQARFQWARFERGVPGELFGTEELRILERPWPNARTAQLLARMEVDASTSGDFFARRMRRRNGRGFDRLVRLKPQHVIIVLGSETDEDDPSDAPDVELLGYAYRPPSGKMYFYEPGEIAHYAPVPDPDFHYRGMSWITAAIRDVQADNAATIHKDRFFRNAATPNLAIRFDPSIGIEKVKEFKELIEAEHKGLWNAYKTLYLGGGADPVPIGKDFRELDFSNTQGKGESRLAAAAGVPPSWVGFSEGLEGSALNAGNFTAARRRLGDGTMQHLWTTAAASLETILTPPQGAQLVPATKGIPFLLMDGLDAAKVQQTEAATITMLIREGYEPKSVVDAVTTGDWTRLKHTGRVSVQLQPATGNDQGDAANEADEGGNT